MVTGMQRVSKPGRRVYVGIKDIPRVKNGIGVAILSTSKGLMTDQDSRRAGLGGEVLCSVLVMGRANQIVIAAAC